jgi:hypothetical protein
MGTNTAEAGNPCNYGNLGKAQPFVFDDFTLTMINALCAK